jgi:hypothetical protein
MLIYKLGHYFFKKKLDSQKPYLNAPKSQWAIWLYTKQEIRRITNKISDSIQSLIEALMFRVWPELRINSAMQLVTANIMDGWEITWYLIVVNHTVSTTTTTMIIVAIAIIGLITSDEWLIGINHCTQIEHMGPLQIGGAPKATNTISCHCK